MTHKQIKQKAKRILRKDRPTFEEWKWFKQQCQAHELSNVTNEIWMQKNF